MREVEVEDLPTTWTTIDRIVLNIGYMETKHIKNCIAMMQRNVPVYRERLDNAMLNYIDDAPDGAADACEAEMMSLWQLDDESFLHHVKPVYKALQKEYEKREKAKE